MKSVREPFWNTWPVFILAGPVIWITHFWIVYLWAEAGCAFGSTWVSPVIVIATVVGIAAIAALRWRSRRRFLERHEKRRDLYFLGEMLAALSIIATLLVGLPAIFLTPC